MNPNCPFSSCFYVVAQFLMHADSTTSTVESLEMVFLNSQFSHMHPPVRKGWGGVYKKCLSTPGKG